MTPAVFLDRDGVIVADEGLSTDLDPAPLAGVGPVLRRLAEAGYRLVLVTNQAIVARGLATEAEVSAAQERLIDRIVAEGGPRLDGAYFCPHHPNATLEAYRAACDCRKPRPGLLLRAARDLAVDLPHSTMVGDRVTDVIAGRAAGCRTVLVRSGAHDAPPIETPDAIPPDVRADFECDRLAEAADWILGGAR